MANLLKMGVYYTNINITRQTILYRPLIGKFHFYCRLCCSFVCDIGLRFFFPIYSANYLTANPTICQRTKSQI